LRACTTGHEYNGEETLKAGVEKTNDDPIPSVSDALDPALGHAMKSQ
jgi:hypothetical protein